MPNDITHLPEPAYKTVNKIAAAIKLSLAHQMQAFFLSLLTTSLLLGLVYTVGGRGGKSI